MTIRRRLAAQLDRAGQRGIVHTRTEIQSDAFGNREFDWNPSHEVICVRSYPNRNIEEERTSGTLEGDRPVFIFPRGTDADPPSGSDRLEYDGVMYELESPTRYETHLEMMGNRIDN